VLKSIKRLVLKIVRIKSSKPRGYINIILLELCWNGTVFSLVNTWPCIGDWAIDLVTLKVSSFFPFGCASLEILPPSQNDRPTSRIVLSQNDCLVICPTKNLRLKVKYFRAKLFIPRSVSTPQLLGVFRGSCCFLL